MVFLVPFAHTWKWEELGFFPLGFASSAWRVVSSMDPAQEIRGVWLAVVVLLS